MQSTSVHNSTPVFGIFLFTTAGMISFFRAFHYVYGLDGVINYTAKTTVMIGRNPIVAHFITPIIGTFLVLGPLLSLLGSLFGGVDSTAWIRFTGFTILGAGFLIFGVSLIACKTKFSSVHLPPALVCTGLGCILYAIGLALHQEVCSLMFLFVFFLFLETFVALDPTWNSSDVHFTFFWRL